MANVRLIHILIVNMVRVSLAPVLPMCLMGSMIQRLRRNRIRAAQQVTLMIPITSAVRQIPAEHTPPVRSVLHSIPLRKLVSRVRCVRAGRDV